MYEGSLNVRANERVQEREQARKNARARERDREKGEAREKWKKRSIKYLRGPWRGGNLPYRTSEASSNGILEPGRERLNAIPFSFFCVKKKKREKEERASVRERERKREDLLSKSMVHFRISRLSPKRPKKQTKKKMKMKQIKSPFCPPTLRIGCQSCKALFLPPSLPPEESLRALYCNICTFPC